MEDQNIEKKPDESVGIILGIISLVCAVTGFLTIVGLVLGIIATVKGNNVKKEGGSSAGFILLCKFCNTRHEHNVGFFVICIIASI